MLCNGPWRWSAKNAFLVQYFRSAHQDFLGNRKRTSCDAEAAGFGISAVLPALRHRRTFGHHRIDGGSPSSDALSRENLHSLSASIFRQVPQSRGPVIQGPALALSTGGSVSLKSTFSTGRLMKAYLCLHCLTRDSLKNWCLVPSEAGCGLVRHMLEDTEAHFSRTVALSLRISETGVSLGVVPRKHRPQDANPSADVSSGNEMVGSVPVTYILWSARPMAFRERTPLPGCPGGLLSTKLRRPKPVSTMSCVLDWVTSWVGRCEWAQTRLWALFVAISRLLLSLAGAAKRQRVLVSSVAEISRAQSRAVGRCARWS